MYRRMVDCSKTMRKTGELELRKLDKDDVKAPPNPHSFTIESEQWFADGKLKYLSF